MGKKKITAWLLCVVMTLSNFAFTFAGEYETTVDSFVLNGITIAATTSCRESFNAHKVGIAKPPLAIATILISLLFVENRLLKSLPYRKL